MLAGESLASMAEDDGILSKNSVVSANDAVSENDISMETDADMFSTIDMEAGVDTVSGNDVIEEMTEEETAGDQAVNETTQEQTSETETEENLTETETTEEGAEDTTGDVVEETTETIEESAEEIPETVVEANGETVEETTEELTAEIPTAQDIMETDMLETSIEEIRVNKLIASRTSAIMHPGDTLKLSVTVVPEGLEKTVSWISSSPGNASVSDTGVVIAMREGNTVITAECDGKTVDIHIDVVSTDAEKNNDKPVDAEGNMIEIADEIWIAGFEKESETLVYTGGKIKQNLRIYHKGTLLKEKTDYTLTYKNNVNAAAYNSAKAPSVTITMKGQYSGGRTLYFTILPRDINEDASQGYEQVVDYSKKIKIPTPTVYYGGKRLAVKKDFICDYSSLPEKYTEGNSYEDGRVYEYTVNGIGNFKGSFTMRLAVISDKLLDLNDVMITLDQKQYSYHGEPLTVSDVQIISARFGKKILDKSFYEYQVFAESVGNGYLEIYPTEAGRNAGYRGRKTVKFKVVGDRSIKNVELDNGWQDTIIFSKGKLLDNGGICQKKTGVLIYKEGNGSEPLIEGVDYTASYSNNKRTGTATVTFKGRGRYTGSLKKAFRILPNTQLEVRWHDTDENGLPTTVYKKNGAVPEFDLLESTISEQIHVLSSKTDYSVKLMNNKKPGNMTCEIIGKGNYKGYRSLTEIKVLTADIKQGTITLKDRQYSTKKNAWKSPVTITDINGKKLKAGTDYDKNVIYRYCGMTEGLVPQAGSIVYVTAVGINNYAGSSITGSYRIFDTNISKLVVKIDTQEYTGKEIELSADDIHVYANKTDAKKGIEMTEPCYEITGYSRNQKAGTAKVTLRGIGSYGGTKTYSFKIKKKDYLTTRVKKITLDTSSLSLGTGNTRTLTATLTPEDAWNKTVIWSTSNKKVATVDKNGVITALKPGSVTIKAVSQDTGKSASCKVRVAVIPITSFSLNTDRIDQYEGTQFQLELKEVQPVDGSMDTIKWESTNSKVASVDKDGLVFLNEAGMAVIRVYTTDGQVEKKCLVISNSRNDTPPESGYVTPQMFRESDDEDDTAAFNAAIKALNATCNTLYVPAGTYRIEAQKGIRFQSDMHFVMSENAVLQAVDNSSTHYNVLYVRDVSNVTISGGQIIGERYEHGGTSGEWGMGIGVYDCSDVTISDVDVSDCWGDGIYVGSKRDDEPEAGSDGIEITNCNLYNNRRNNLSIVCADNVTVDGCTFKNANGTAPGYGIDIEPNYPTNPSEHITIANSFFEGNAEAAMGIITAANDIKIEGCTINGIFINYAGTNVTIADTAINGEMDARIGVTLSGSTTINDGSSAEDEVVACFDAAKDSYTIGKYNVDEKNQISAVITEDALSASGKTLQIKRLSTGNQEAGCYLDLSELTLDGSVVLEAGATYRFEYVMKGSGLWGIRTDQTGWYPCAPVADKYTTGYVTYQAKAKDNCRLLLYATDRMADIEWNISSIKVYKIE